jgi:spoIIIJ-associated protein
MIALLGQSAQVRETATDNGWVLSVQTEKPGRLIGRKGQYLESLELVLNRIVHRATGEYADVIIDIDGYQRPERAPRAARQKGGDEPVPAELERLALDAAKEVRLWGEPKTLGPLTAHERRAIHAVLRKVPEVESVSGPDEGGNRKKVTIRPRPAAGAAARPPAATGATAAGEEGQG